jgi:hypothetical protein
MEQILAILTTILIGAAPAIEKWWKKKRATIRRDRYHRSTTTPPVRRIMPDLPKPAANIQPTFTNIAPEDEGMSITASRHSTANFAEEEETAQPASIHYNRWRQAIIDAEILGRKYF